MVATSTLAIFPRAASYVLQALTSITIEDMESINCNPFGLGDYQNYKVMEESGLTTGKGVNENGGYSQAMVEIHEDEYMIENEDLKDDMIMPHEFFTPNRDHKLVNYKDSTDDSCSPPSRDFVGLAIKEVDTEGRSLVERWVPIVRHNPYQVLLLLLLIPFLILVYFLFAFIYLFLIYMCLILTIIPHALTIVGLSMFLIILWNAIMCVYWRWEAQMGL